MLAGGLAHAQTGGANGLTAPSEALQLRTSPRLQERLTEAESREAPMHLEAGRIVARPDLDLQLEGGVMLRRPGLSVQAPRLDYDQVQDRLQAEGGVRIRREQSRFEGPRLDLRLDAFRGRFEQPRFDLLQIGGHG